MDHRPRFWPGSWSRYLAAEAKLAVWRSVHLKRMFVAGSDAGGDRSRGEAVADPCDVDSLFELADSLGLSLST